MDKPGAAGASPLYNVVISNADIAEDSRGRFTVYYVRVVEVNAPERSWLVLRRYRDFRSLRQQLGRHHAQISKLEFPGRRLIGRMSNKVVHERQLALQSFMNQVLCLCPDAPELRFFLDAVQHHVEDEERRRGRGMVVVADGKSGDLVNEVQLQNRWGETMDALARIRLATILSLLQMLPNDRESTANPEDHLPSAKIAAEPVTSSAANSLRPDDFTVLSTLKQGAFGVVSQVRPVGSPEETVYAMKRLSKREIVEQQALTEVVGEIVLMQGLRHPFYAELHFAFQTDESIYLVLDYCGGGALFDHLKDHIFFNEDIVQFYAAELVVALQHLHSHHLVFRDLKPENILLDAEGHLKLTDFSFVKSTFAATNGVGTSPKSRGPLAPPHSSTLQRYGELSLEDENHGQRDVGVEERKAAEPEVSEELEGRTGELLIGSPEYLAPEILKGSGGALDDDLGPEIDWWAVGVVVYEMATGVPPFHDADFVEMRAKILGTSVQYPVDAALPFDLQYFIAGLLEKDPALRLGCTSADMRMHPFFVGMDWEALEARLVSPPELNLRRSSSILPILDGPKIWCA